MNHSKISIALLLLSSLLFTACDREIISRNMEFEALNPINADTAARHWKTILLTKADELPCATPVAITAADYKLEVLEIKSWQNKMTSTEQAQIKYWSAGVVLRWNEIMRELVAKYNLPPYQNADGTYPIPSSANPLAYPFFPFANPPYAARAYAYLSTAQYDALVAAHHYKALFKRARPAVNDASVQQLISATADFAFPCEEAVAAGASAAILTLLFPGEQDYIQQKLNECKNYRIMAGVNVRSEVDAGEDLGKAVAAKFIARARTDRAGKAVGTPTDWANLETNTTAKGEIAWLSQESPKRPPMLPLFGKTMGFLVDTTQVVMGRPAPPPSTQSEQFKKELDEVLWYSQHPTRERMRIVHFWGDGISTYTPPGHWNAIACDDFVGLRISEVRWARNLALLNMSMFDAAICCWDAKYSYFLPRPSQINPAIKTLTGLPNFPAFTSGHSTFSGAAETILGHLNPARAAAYTAMAEEASLSRLYGAIHYRSDIEVGMQMGKTIGQKAIDRAKIDGAE
jgi:hypothetical protein